MRSHEELRHDMRDGRQTLKTLFERVSHNPGQESYTPERGEFWMPEHLRIHVGEEPDLLELRMISRVCDDYGLRVRDAPESKSDQWVCLVEDRADRVRLN